MSEATNLTDEEREAIKAEDGGDRIDTVETLLLASISLGPTMTLEEHGECITAPVEMVVDALEHLIEEEYVVEDPSGSDAGLERARRVCDGYVNYMVTPRGRHQLGVEVSILMDTVQFCRQATNEQVPVYRGEGGESP